MYKKEDDNKVIINGSNVTINGVIIAESLEIEGSNVVFNVSDALSSNNDDYDITLDFFQFWLANMNFDGVVNFS